jgi:4-hydroxy-4-methyl-2-oxoglutarate aldolase
VLSDRCGHRVRYGVRPVALMPAGATATNVAPPSASTLLAFDTCVLSDALDSLHLRGVLHGLHPQTIGGRFAGRAVTVQLGLPPAEPKAATRHLGTAAIEAAGPSDVIVVANQGRLDCASWGGLLSQAAVCRGVSGIVIDGALRDVDEATHLGLPVHARGVTPVTARGRTVETSWGEPVDIAGTTVSRGDWIVADGSGVIAIPHDRVVDVLTTARALAAREFAMGAAIRAGQPVSEVMGGRYESLLEPTSADPR